MRTLWLVILLLNTNVVAQQSAAITSFKINSTILKEERLFDIYVPDNQKTRMDVIYVLDGQAQFTNVLNALKQLNINNKIVVGLGNIWLRDRDYTPSHVSASKFIDSTAAAVSGGGDRFISHLQNELIPYINTHYNSSKTNIIIGHSLGGLIAVKILLDHPSLFQKYALIDPSMWWDDQKLLREVHKKKKKLVRASDLYLAIANTREKDMPSIDLIRTDQTEKTALSKPSVLFLDYLKNNQNNNIRFNWKYYREHDHMSVFEPAARDAIRFLVSGK